jgi:hypothetical protein
MGAVGTLVAADEDDAVRSADEDDAVRLATRMVQAADDGWVMGLGSSEKFTCSKGGQWPWW